MLDNANVVFDKPEGQMDIYEPRNIGRFYGELNLNNSSITLYEYTHNPIKASDAVTVTSSDTIINSTVNVKSIQIPNDDHTGTQPYRGDAVFFVADVQNSTLDIEGQATLSYAGQDRFFMLTKGSTMNVGGQFSINNSAKVQGGSKITVGDSLKLAADNDKDKSVTLTVGDDDAGGSIDVKGNVSVERYSSINLAGASESAKASLTALGDFVTYNWHGSSLTASGIGAEVSIGGLIRFLYLPEDTSSQDPVGDNQLSFGFNLQNGAKATALGIETEGVSDHAGMVSLDNGATLTLTALGNAQAGTSSADNLAAVVNRDAEYNGTTYENDTKGQIVIGTDSKVTILHKSAILYDAREGTANNLESNKNSVVYDTTMKVADGVFDVSASGVLEISDLGELTLDEINAIKQKLFKDPSVGTLAGYTLSGQGGSGSADGGDSGSGSAGGGDSGSGSAGDAVDLPAGEIDYQDSLPYKGTTILDDRLVKGVQGTQTGSTRWGAAELSDGESSLSVGDGASVRLGNAEVNSGKFITKSDGTVADAELGDGAVLTLDGDGAIGSVAGSGTFASTNGSVSMQDLEAGAVLFENTSVSSASAALSSNDDESLIKSSTFQVAGDASLGNMTLSDSTLLVTGTATLNGTLKADPSVMSFGTLNFTGDSSKLFVLEGTTAVVGTNDASGAAASANLVLGKSVDLSQGGYIYLNGTEDNDDVSSSYTPSSQVTVGADSSLVITQGAIDDAAGGAVIALKSGGGVSVDSASGGSIRLQGVKVSSTASYNLFGTDSGVSLDSSAISSGLSLYDASVSNGVASFSYNGSAVSSSGLIAPLQQAVAQRALSSDSSSNWFEAGDSTAVGIVSSAFAGGSSAASSAALANTIASYAYASGAYQATELASRSLYDAVGRRAGFGAAIPSELGAVSGRDVTVWALPVFRSVSGDGFSSDAGDYGTNTDLYGLSAGFDVAAGSSFRVGAAVLAGGMNLKSRGALGGVSGDADIAGASLYAIYANGPFKAQADAGYMKVSNDTDFGAIKADIDSDALSAGAALSWTFEAGALKVVPHAGARVMRIGVDGFDVNLGSQKLMSASEDHAVLWKFPVGITLTSEFQAGDFTVKPTADLTAIMAAGDKDTLSEATLEGFAPVEVRADIADSTAWSGSIGVSAVAASGVNLGAGYSYIGSSSLSEHAFSVSFGYSF